MAQSNEAIIINFILIFYALYGINTAHINYERINHYIKTTKLLPDSKKKEFEVLTTANLTLRRTLFWMTFISVLFLHRHIWIVNLSSILIIFWSCFFGLFGFLFNNKLGDILIGIHLESESLPKEIKTILDQKRYKETVEELRKNNGLGFHLFILACIADVSKNIVKIGCFILIVRFIDFLF